MAGLARFFSGSLWFCEGQDFAWCPHWPNRYFLLEDLNDFSDWEYDDVVASFVCYSHGFGYIAIDTANGCIFSWIRSGVGSARSYVQGTLRALGKHRSWMLCEDPVSNSFEVFVCIPKIASQGRFVGVISITYYGYILRDAFGFPFRIDIGTNISIRAAQDEESTSSWFGQLLARWLSSVRQALRYDTG